MGKISTFIIVNNEFIKIESIISFIKHIADEIIIVMNIINHDIVKIAKKYDIKIIKIFNELLSRNDWIFHINLDVELPIELRHEIEFIFAAGLQDNYYSYRIKLVRLHHNDDLPRLFAPCHKYIHIYDRKFCTIKNNYMLFNENKVYHLNEMAYSRLGSKMALLAAKTHFHSILQISDINSLHHCVMISIFVKSILYLLKTLIIQRYFIFGFDGLIESIFLTYTRFVILLQTAICTRNNNIIQE